MSKGSEFSKVNVRLRKGFYILSKIIFSFNSAAYYVLWLKFLQILLSPIDYTIFLIERLFLKPEGNNEIPLIFVVGIQRTGSTLVSQFIEKTFKFFPIGNFNSIIKRSSYYLHKRFSRIYTKPHKSYQNFYGISRGFFSIGDCYELWDRWFGKNHYVIPDNISEKKLEDLKHNFTRLYNAYRKPILTKNNRNSLLLPVFEKCFSNAFYVIVKRDPVAVIRSTIKASKDFFGDDKFLWGLYPTKDFDTKDYENIVEAATVQFLMLDKILNNQIEKLSEDSHIIVDYNDFCENPGEFQKDIRVKLSEKPNYFIDNEIKKSEPFHISERLKNQDLDDQIKTYLQKWENKI